MTVKKTVRTAALVLALLLILSATAFADMSENDRYVIGAWRAFSYNDGEFHEYTGICPLVFNDDLTGSLTIGDTDYAFTWSFLTDNGGAYIYELTVTGDSAGTFYAGYMYGSDTYSLIAGELCLLIGDDLAVWFEKA